MIDLVDEPTTRRTTVNLAWIAESLRVSCRTAARLNAEGRIPGRLTIPGHDRLVRFDRETIERWLAALAD